MLAAGLHFLLLIFECYVLTAPAAAASGNSAKSSSPSSAPARPPTLCETCQSMAYDAHHRLHLRKSKVDFEIQRMHLVETQCQTLRTYALTSGWKAQDMGKVCNYLMKTRGLEAKLEQILTRDIKEIALRKALCLPLNSSVTSRPASTEQGKGKEGEDKDKGKGEDKGEDKGEGKGKDKGKGEEEEICFEDELWSAERMPNKRPTEGEYNKEQSKLFFKKLAKDPSVVVLKSGLNYRIVQNGTGTRKPKLKDKVMVHYQGMLLNGEVFEQTYNKEPVQVSPSGVILGWRQALRMMVKGDIWELYVPPKLGYRERGQLPLIGPNAALLFRVELLGITGIDDEATLKPPNQKEKEAKTDETNQANTKATGATTTEDSTQKKQEL